MRDWIRPDDIPMMAAEDVIDLFREATEDDVGRIIPRLISEGAMLAGVPHADLLEFFNRMIDELTGERAAAEEQDDTHIADAAEVHRRREQG